MKMRESYLTLIAKLSLKNAPKPIFSGKNEEIAMFEGLLFQVRSDMRVKTLSVYYLGISLLISMLMGASCSKLEILLLKNAL